MNYNLLSDLITVQQDCAVTVTLDTFALPNPKAKQNALIIKNALNEARERVLERFKKRDVETVLMNLDKLEASLERHTFKPGLVIFVSEDYADFLDLPFSPGKNIKVDTGFHLRTIIRQLEQMDHYYLLTISQSHVRLIEAYDDVLIEEVKDKNFPFKNTVFYTTDRSVRSQAGRTDKDAQEFFRSVNRAFATYYDALPLPIILAGTRENIANYLEVTHERKFIIGSINGNYDTTLKTELQDLIKECGKIIADYKQERYEHFAATIEESRFSNLLEFNIGSLYPLAANGQVKELIVEFDYYVPAFVDESEKLLTFNPEKGVSTDDAVDIIIRTVLSTGGSITFVPKDHLGDGERICGILRWR